MRSTLALLGSVLLSIALLVAGQGLLNLLVVLRLELGGASPSTVALVMAAYFAGQGVGALTAARFVATFGHIRAFAAFAAGIAALILLHALLPQPGPLVLLRLLDGACMVGALAVAEGWLNDRAPSGRRGLALSLYTTAFYLAMSGGQAMAGLGQPQDHALYMIAAVLVALSVIPVALTRTDAPEPPEASFLSPRVLFGHAPLAVTGALTAGACFSFAISLGPGFLLAGGARTAAVSWSMAAGISLGMILQWPVGRLSDHLDRRTVLQGLVALMALSNLLSLAASALGPAASTVAVVLLTAWMVPLYPLALAHASDRLRPEQLVGGSATLLLLSAVGAAVGPLLAAPVMTALGPAGLFVSASAVSIALLAYVTWRRRVHDPVEDQGAFVVMPRTTVALAELDPRVEVAKPTQGSSTESPAPAPQGPRR
jgi:MFS family permease